MGAGRPNKYETHVKPRFDEIKKWCKRGATDKEIIQMLGIGKSAYYDYMVKYTEFSELIKKNRINAVEEIKNALYKRAVGFQYVETKESRNEDENGNVSVKTEKIVKTVVPDPASCMILLKHWDTDNEWTSEPAILKLKKKELKLKEKIAENNEW